MLLTQAAQGCERASSDGVSVGDLTLPLNCRGVAQRRDDVYPHPSPPPAVSRESSPLGHELRKHSPGPHWLRLSGEWVGPAFKCTTQQS